jgi:hypothetical protein
MSLKFSATRSIVAQLVLVLCLTQLSGGQYFDPELDDKTYLDNLQKRIESEVKTTREDLIVQAQIVEFMTKQFVAAQLKENLFIVRYKIQLTVLENLVERNITGLLDNWFDRRFEFLLKKNLSNWSWIK